MRNAKRSRSIRTKGLMLILTMNLSLGLSTVHAALLMDNMPGNDGLGYGLFNTQALAVGFTPASDGVISSFVTRFLIPSSTYSLSYDIQSDLAGSPSGSTIAALTGPASWSANTAADYTFTPDTTFNVTQGATYWLVVRSLGIGMQWKASNPLQNYTQNGVNFVNTKFANPTNWTQSAFNGAPSTPDLQIYGSLNNNAVPEPDSWMLWGLGAVMLSRLNARRIRAS